MLVDDPAVPSLILIEDNTVTLPARQLRKHSLATLDRGPPRVVAIGLGLNPFQQVLILGGTATPDTRRTTTNLNLSTRWRRARGA